ncbi:hypothetical protein Glove_33g284 [Diversispora epigaea]|uniref:ATP-dependent DNA helicase n=1 Tax=Diversispora epigaea TaxID=1348612 RepID=A0A397JIZ4_9GLOM|nr:hypothetical protein Glove_33g284 [Diversispora epigaea]
MIDETLVENDENPYYDDTIMKYMAQPHLPEFENLTYPQYFERYSITPLSSALTNRQIYQDDLNNYIVKRSKEIIIKYRFLKIEDGKLYFYQQLLLKVPTRSENNTSSIKLDNLKILPHVYPETAMLELLHDQYHVLSTISMYMGKSNNRKWPYYFITGSTETGGFQTKVFTDKELKDDLINVETLIIDEISMVSDKLLDFISNLFASLHNNALAFGGINVIVVGDFAQLPPITGQPVFNATVWKLFCLLFLKIYQ